MMIFNHCCFQNFFFLNIGKDHFLNKIALRLYTYKSFKYLVNSILYKEND